MGHAPCAGEKLPTIKSLIPIAVWHGLAVDPLYRGREAIGPDTDESAESNQRKLAYLRELHCGQKQ